MEDKCPYCGSTSIIWRGYRHNRNSDKRMRLCKRCGRKFTPDDGFLRMRFRAEDIEYALSLRKKGFSLAEVQLAYETALRNFIKGGVNRVILATDGLVELRNPEGEMFGTGRLMSLIKEYQALPAAQLRDRIKQAIHEFHPDPHLPDDITLVLVERKVA